MACSSALPTASVVGSSVACTISSLLHPVADDERAGVTHLRYAAPPTCVFMLLDSALDKSTGQYRQLVPGLPPGVVALFPINSAPFVASASSKEHCTSKASTSAD